MNETTNTRTICFSQYKSLDLRFHGEDIINLREMTFCFFKRKFIISYVFRGKKKTYFFTFVFKKRERKCIISLTSFPRREFSLREFSFKREKKTFFFFKQWQFLDSFKTPRNCSPYFSHLLGRVGSAHLGTQTQLQQLLLIIEILFESFKPI